VLRAHHLHPVWLRRRRGGRRLGLGLRGGRRGGGCRGGRRRLLVLLHRDALRLLPLGHIRLLVPVVGPVLRAHHLHPVRLGRCGGCGGSGCLRDRRVHAAYRHAHRLLPLGHVRGFVPVVGPVLLALHLHPGAAGRRGSGGGLPGCLQGRLHLRALLSLLQLGVREPCVALLHPVDPVPPEGGESAAAAEHLAVGEDDNSPLGSGEHHIHTPGISQEPDGSVAVRPGGGEHDQLLLHTLEAVDGVYGNLVQLGRAWDPCLHALCHLPLQLPLLCSVRCENPDLLRRHVPALHNGQDGVHQQPGFGGVHSTQAVLGLVPAAQRPVRPVSGRHVHQGDTAVPVPGPGEPGDGRAVGVVDSVDEGAVVEGLIREGADGAVHAALLGEQHGRGGARVD